MADKWLERIGPCCACGQWKLADVVVPLGFVAPVAGTGWGCAVCRRDRNGAIAVCCSTCAAAGVPPLQAVRGHVPSTDRVPISELVRMPMHDAAAHQWYDMWVAAGMKRLDPLIIFDESASMWMLPSSKGVNPL